MIFITTYRVKQLSKDETKELMGVFADKGVVGNVKAHYQAADNSHGVLMRLSRSSWNLTAVPPPRPFRLGAFAVIRQRSKEEPP